MMRLEGKKAIVTGGNRGIGKAIAHRLADEGADVAVCASRSLESAE
ncbi:TPA: oxidoreductase, partial [Candidatus Latescibacteria bacterium]|nr:oxidoreductase [Candidatus Latescibacterota bacterium]